MTRLKPRRWTTQFLTMVTLIDLAKYLSINLQTFNSELYKRKLMKRVLITLTEKSLRQSSKVNKLKFTTPESIQLKKKIKGLFWQVREMLLTIIKIWESRILLHREALLKASKMNKWRLKGLKSMIMKLKILLNKHSKLSRKTKKVSILKPIVSLLQIKAMFPLNSKFLNAAIAK